MSNKQNDPHNIEDQDADAAMQPEQGQDQDEAGQGDNETAFEEPADDALAEQLAAAEAEIQQLKDGFLRAKAESENVARRAQNEVQNARKFAIEGFAKELLSVIDSLEQASKVDIADNGDEVMMSAVIKMREGLELTNKQLSGVMQKFGIAEVEASQGVKFNPDLHQAISMVAGNDDIESGHIIDVMQKGFSLNERLLRPAMVIVAQ